MKNQRGVITVDFIFAMTLVMGFFVILFSLALTMTTASVAQYISFAGARSYMASHVDSNSQRTHGQAKFRQLRDGTEFTPLFKNGWFLLDEPVMGSLAEGGENTPVDEFQAVVAQNDTDNFFYGVRSEFTAKILDFNIPFFGSTTGGENDSDFFKTNVGSYLGREDTFQNCHRFTTRRWPEIRKRLGSSVPSGEDAAVPIMDNGC